MKVKIEIPYDAKVLLLEDSIERINWFTERIPTISVASTVESAIFLLAKVQYNCLFLDHDLGFLDQFGKPGPEGDGTQFAKHLAETGFLASLVVIHSWNPDGAKRMKASLPQAHIIQWGQFEITRK